MTVFTIAFRSGATGGSAGITQDAADADTWTGGALNTDSEVQNTGCSGAKVSNATVHFYHTGTSRDFIGGANDGDHVYTWINCLTPNLDTIANGGLRVRIGDTASSYRDFYVGGDGTVADDPYAGGWKNFVVDPTLAADASRIFDVSTPDMNIADTFGAVIKTVAMISGNFDNGLVDAIRIGTGLRVINGDGADPDATFADFVAADEGTKANKYGVIRNVGGVNLIQGRLFFGDGTTTTVFTDTSAIIVFEEANVATDFYEIYVNTDSTVTFGAISAGVTSGGCFFDSEDTTHAYALTVVEGGTVEAVLNAYGTTFNEYRIATLNPSTTMQDSTFSAGGQITLNGATLTDCSVVSSTVGADTGALLVDNNSEWGGGSPVVTGCFFGDNAANANSGAIEISATGSYTFDNITFSGNSFDVINSSGGAVTITVSGGGDTPSVRNLTTSTTTVISTVDVDVHCKDQDGIDIQDMQVYISKDPPTAYTAGAGNTTGDGDLVLTETIDADVPQSSWAIVLDLSRNKTLPYRFVSHDGANTLTFPTAVTGSATSTDGTSPTTTLISTSTNFLTADIQEGDSIINTTTGGWAFVDEIVDADTIITSPISTGGQWTSGDGFKLHTLVTTLVSGSDPIDIPLANAQTDANGDIPTLAYDASEVPTNIKIRFRYGSGGTNYIPPNPDPTGQITSAGFVLDQTISEDDVNIT